MRNLPKYTVDENGCWIIQNASLNEGYARISIEGEQIYGHRLFYEEIKGPITEGLTLDHLCRKRACVNPDHLEAVTLEENVLRGQSPPAINAKKTHCINGHSLTEENIYNSALKRGWRYCKICAREKARNSLYKNKKIFKDRLDIWRKNNPEKVKEQKKRWRIKNKGRITNIRKQWLLNNKEKLKEYKRNWMRHKRSKEKEKCPDSR